MAHGAGRSALPDVPDGALGVHLHPWLIKPQRPHWVPSYILHAPLPMGMTHITRYHTRTAPHGSTPPHSTHRAPTPLHAPPSTQAPHLHVDPRLAPRLALASPYDHSIPFRPQLICTTPCSALSGTHLHVDARLAPRLALAIPIWPHPTLARPQQIHTSPRPSFYQSAAPTCTLTLALPPGLPLKRHPNCSSFISLSHSSSTRPVLSTCLLMQ